MSDSRASRVLLTLALALAVAAFAGFAFVVPFVHGRAVIQVFGGLGIAAIACAVAGLLGAGFGSIT